MQKRRSRLDLRINEDMYVWLSDYSKRVDKPMSTIIKDYLEELRRKDERARQAERINPKKD